MGDSQEALTKLQIARSDGVTDLSVRLRPERKPRFLAWMFFVRSRAPVCSPNTIPNSPSRATIGGAGLFTRMTP